MRQTESATNKSGGCMPADILSSDESVFFDDEQNTNPVQVRPNFTVGQNLGQNDFNQNNESTKHYNIRPSQCTEAIPILKDVNLTFISLNSDF